MENTALVNNLTNILNGLDDSQEKLEKDAFDVINSSDTSLNLVRESIGSVEEILKMIDTLNAVVEESSEKIQKLEKLSADIEQFASVIASIANRTNILSLNASIEAARAGEVGKGFAVVAEEIRQLAENSKNTANDIQGISVRVIAAVNQLMTNAQDLMNFIQNQIMNDYVEFEAATDMYYEKADHMDTITGLFNKNIMSLRNIMAEMNDGITNISAVVEENVRGVSNATENVTKLANSILNIHEQVIKNVDSSKYLLEELNSFQQI